jgi:uncharacterized protein with von Willebrand factor type A (vWA) domain
MRPPEQRLAEAAVALGRGLRDAGLPCSVDDEIVLCRALGEIDIGRRDRVYWAARACFVRGPDAVAVFDGVFARFWAGLELGGGRPVAEHGESDRRMPAPQHGGESLQQFRRDERRGESIGGQPVRAAREISTAAGDGQAECERRGVLAAYSPDEALAESEPLRYVEDELAVVRRLAELLRAAAPERRSRRLRPARRPAGRLDVRRTLREALRTEGEALRPAYATPSRRPRRLLFLCDVSGSMERCSRELLASLQAAVGAHINAEAFVFATRITRLTGALAGRDVERALAVARESVADWSGGTRIGQALAEFNRAYAPLGLARGAIVIVVSDGWDRGDPELLAAELQRLRLQCRRLVWLNPRPASLDGQPLAVGMRAALPYVDDFIPGHDPRAVGQFARLIAALDAGRPARSQRPLVSVRP